ncbi:hypothetical protein OAA43_00375 [bacterium]|nr:hypothetical protein [bacterium]
MWSSSSIPTEAAWSVLKRDGGLGSLPPELQESMQSFYEQIPDEQREKIEMIAQAVEQMGPEKKDKIQQMMMQTLKHNGDKLPEILNQADPEGIFAPQQSEPGTFQLSMRGLGYEIAYSNQPISKLVPLVVVGIGVLLAADGVNRSQGAKESAVGLGLKEIGGVIGTNDPPPEGSWAGVTEYDDKAVFMDPFMGIEVTETEDPEWWQSALAGGLGAAQGLSGGTVFGRGARASVAGARGGRASRLAAKEAEKEAAAIAGGTVGQATRAKANRQAHEAAAKHHAARQSKLRSEVGSMRVAPAARRAAQGVNSIFQTKLEDIAAPFVPDTGGAGNNIHGTASANPSAGGGGTGVGGVGNRAGMGQGNKQIWSGAVEEKLGGAYGTKKGDNMKIGEQILKEVDMRIHKAHCGTTHKADCPTCGKGDCKCKDSTKKGSKKPAHGMVIIIGSKDAGPGPSKNGKRVKKD